MRIWKAWKARRQLKREIAELRAVRTGAINELEKLQKSFNKVIDKEQ